MKSPLGCSVLAGTFCTRAINSLCFLFAQCAFKQALPQGQLKETKQWQKQMSICGPKSLVSSRIEKLGLSLTTFVIL